MGYKEIINGKEVHFEKVEIIDNHGHSIEWSMDGFTGDKLTHNAIASYTYGGDELEDIYDIQPI